MTEVDTLAPDEAVGYIREHYTWRQPGWTLTVDYEPQLHQGWLRLVATVRNTYEPDNPALGKVAHTFPMPPYFHGERMVDNFVRRCIHSAVCHEADEWFRKDGVMIFDPHAKTG